MNKIEPCTLEIHVSLFLQWRNATCSSEAQSRAEDQSSAKLNFLQNSGELHYESVAPPSD